MADVLLGFAVVATVVAFGYLAGVLKVLGTEAIEVLTRSAFYVFAPPLLFLILSRVDIAHLLTGQLPIFAFVALLTALVYIVVVKVWLTKETSRITVGALSSSYVNSTNIGLPLAAYILGDAALAAPVLLFQLIVMTPLALTVLDISTLGRTSMLRMVLSPFRNPLIIGSLLGFLVSAFEVPIPEVVTAPLDLMGQAAIPVLLLALGLSLAKEGVWDAKDQRTEIGIAVTMKLVVMPAIAWLLGHFVFDLDPEALFSVVILSALPTAQNVFTYATKYNVATSLARDSVVITTIASLPAMLVIALLLAPA